LKNWAAKIDKQKKRALESYGIADVEGLRGASGGRRTGIEEGFPI
jgi:hypothetical protein